MSTPSSAGRLVLAYSGGLDTSVAIQWLSEQKGYDVIACAIDVGQAQPGELDRVRQRGLDCGALEAVVIDARDEFADDYVADAIRANALYMGKYPLVSALSRPLITNHLIATARERDAVAIAHGCTGKGNDQVRLDVSSRALNPSIRVIAPAREWGMTRPDEIEYARGRGIPVPATIESPYSTDANLWGRSIACGVLEDPWCEPPEEIYTLTKNPAECPDQPAYLEIEFASGVPITVNGVPMSPVELIGSIETIAGAHGVGRIDMVENRLVGIKSREIYEAPAAVVLHAAHKELEKLVTPRDLERLKHDMGRLYADLVYNGLWFTPTREAVDAFTAKVQERVTGVVRVKLFKGTCTVVGRRSPFALYEHALATYDAGDTFDHSAAEGFIRIWGLPVETAARRARQAVPAQA